METETYLEDHRDEIVSHAVVMLKEMALRHYQPLSLEKCSLRYKRLFFMIVKCMKKRTVMHIIDYMKNLARERYSAGYDLQEVQAACNILEEVMRHYLLHMPVDLTLKVLGENLTLMSRIFSAGKDYLSDTYIIMITENKHPDIDVTALFNGI